MRSLENEINAEDTPNEINAEITKAINSKSPRLIELMIDGNL